jgi:hypothetical protein
VQQQNGVSAQTLQNLTDFSKMRFGLLFKGITVISSQIAVIAVSEIRQPLSGEGTTTGITTKALPVQRHGEVGPPSSFQ